MSPNRLTSSDKSKSPKSGPKCVDMVDGGKNPSVFPDFLVQHPLTKKGRRNAALYADSLCDSLPLPRLRHLGSGFAHVLQVLPGVARVDAPHDLCGVAELVGYALEGVSSLDRFAGPGVPDAISGELLPVQSRTNAGHTESFAPRITAPLSSVRVHEHPFGLRPCFEPRQELRGHGVERDDPRLAGLARGLVFVQPDVRELPEENITPGHFAHLASSGSGVPQEEQSGTQDGGCPEQGTVLGFLGRPTRLGRGCFEYLRQTVGVSINHLPFFVVGSPTEASDDGIHGTLACVLGLPVRVSSQPFGEIELVAVHDELIGADECLEIREVTFAVGDVIGGDVFGSKSAVKGSAVRKDKVADSDGIGRRLLEQCDSGHRRSPRF